MSYTLRTYRPQDAEQTIALWEEVGLTRPWNDPHTDIEQAYSTWPKLFLVAESEGQIVGTVMSGYDGHRGWLYYLAAHPDAQGKGIGTALVAEAEDRLRALGCTKVQLMVRTGNDQVLEFYRKLGYEASDVAVTGKRLD